MCEDPDRPGQEADGDPAVVGIAEQSQGVARTADHADHQPEKTAQADDAGFDQGPEVLRIHEAKPGDAVAQYGTLDPADHGVTHAVEPLRRRRIEADHPHAYRRLVRLGLERIGDPFLHGDRHQVAQEHRREGDADEEESDHGATTP